MAIEQKKEFRHIVRVFNTDLDSSKPVIVGLTNIKGVNDAFANAICNVLKLNKNEKLGNMSEADTDRMTEVIENLEKYNFPKWMLNRRKDYETGKDTHLFSADLELTTSNDIKRQKKIKSYKGLRHSKGLTVRGQRTKSNFRRNKGTVVGVKRKAAPAKADKPSK